MPKLLTFTVGNFRSFLQNRTFTFCVPESGAQKETDGKPHEAAGELNKVSAVYGANSSGKSNLVKAMSAMRNIVLDSVRINEGESLHYDSFALIDRPEPGPQTFELSYLDEDGAIIRYGFSNTREAIHNEWLFIRPEAGQSEHPLFLRNGDGIGINHELFPEGIDLEDKVNENRLFLSLCGQLNGKISNRIILFFIKGLNIISGVRTDVYGIHTRRAFLEHTPVAARAKEFMRKVQLGFDDILVKEISERSEEYDEDGAVETWRMRHSTRVFSVHRIYDAEGQEVNKKSFSFDRFESDGTRKIFSISVPLFDILSRGAVLVVDELDSQLHPLLSQALVRLFTSEESNPHGAQLLFTTHDTRLLADDLLTSSQIWFTEKDSHEATDLYRLSDITMPDGSSLPRRQNMEQNYINGRYGAIPYFKF